MRPLRIAFSDFIFSRNDRDRMASFDPTATAKDQVSFGGLVREASEALKKAQEAGGNRFSAPELPPVPKRNRISIG